MVTAKKAILQPFHKEIHGNGVLSTNVFCQNIANQLQGDGNAINKIAVQNGGYDDDDDTGNGASGNSFETPLSQSSGSPRHQNIQPPMSSNSLSTKGETTESIIKQYVQARIEHAIQARLNYLNKIRDL